MSIKNVDCVLDEMGFLRVQIPNAGNGHFWYILQGADYSNSCYLRVEYKSRMGGYSVKFGIVAEDVMWHLRKSADDIKIFLHQMVVSNYRFEESPCWTMFDLGVILKCRLMVFPTPVDQDSLLAWRQDMRVYLDLVLRQAGDKAGLFDLLLRNDPGYEWAAGNVVLRAAEIISLSCFNDFDSLKVRESLILNDKIIRQDKSDDMSVEQVIDGLFHVLRPY